MGHSVLPVNLGFGEKYVNINVKIVQTMFATKISAVVAMMVISLYKMTPTMSVYFVPTTVKYVQILIVVMNVKRVLICLMQVVRGARRTA